MTYKLWKAVILLLLVIPLSLACKQAYDLDEDVVLFDIIEESGLGASCNMTVYNSTHHISNGTMNVSGYKYTYNASRLKKGTYTSYIICNKSGFEYLGECKFKVEEDDSMIIGIIILLPIILGIFFLIGAVTLNKSHWHLKIFLYLLSIITFFSSMHFGLLSVVKYFDFPELQNLMGTTTYWVGLVFYVLVSYFIIVFVIYMIHGMAQKRKEKLHY
jgi:hypothetical protein